MTLIGGWRWRPDRGERKHKPGSGRMGAVAHVAPNSNRTGQRDTLHCGGTGWPSVAAPSMQQQVRQKQERHGGRKGTRQ
eukprot:6577813-Pyramimonas_sp.AAC.1